MTYISILCPGAYSFVLERVIRDLIEHCTRINTMNSMHTYQLHNQIDLLTWVGLLYMDLVANFAEDGNFSLFRLYYINWWWFDLVASRQYKTQSFGNKIYSLYYKHFLNVFTYEDKHTPIIQKYTILPHCVIIFLHIYRGHNQAKCDTMCSFDTPFNLWISHKQLSSYV